MKKNVTKEKSTCDCCGAKGFKYTEPYQDYGRLHIYDEGSKKNRRGGFTAWRSSCTHLTKEKETHYRVWSEYDCNCSCEC